MLPQEIRNTNTVCHSDSVENEQSAIYVRRVMAMQELMKVASIELLSRLPSDFRRAGMGELAAKAILSQYGETRYQL